jgi:hypothetical protein
MDVIAMVRTLLRELDGEAATIAGNLLDGRAADFTGYRELVARRQGLLSARRLILEALSTEQRRFLGLEGS